VLRRLGREELITSAGRRRFVGGWLAGCSRERPPVGHWRGGATDALREVRMRQRATLVVVATLALQPTLLRAPATAQEDDALTRLLNRAAVGDSRRHDEAIERAFEDVLDREPTDKELRRYRLLMEEEYWTERDVRDDLRERSDDRRHSRRQDEDPDKVIRRAYEDILDREPDEKGLRLYRSRMIDEDWTERDVREALRKSPEYARHRQESADEIVRRAYEDVLGREPDSRGLRMYRSKVLDQGWDEHDVRRALERSPEYRERNRLSDEEAEEIVRRAYLSVLDRDPDPAGMRGYKAKVLSDHWSEQDVARELRKSDEYRSKQR
jgi:TorA maturation chaperone TorD